MRIIKALFGFFFLSLITPHSISVTHHLSLKTPHPVWHHYSLVITQYFSTVCEFTWCSFYSLFFLQPPTQYPNSTNPVKKKKKKPQKPFTEPSERRRKKKNPETARSERRRRSHLVWKEKKKKDEEITRIEPSAEKKKKKKRGSKVAAKSDSGTRYVMLFTKMPLKTELWKPKGAFGLANLVTQFSVSITHNLKMVGLIAKRLFGKR